MGGIFGGIAHNVIADKCHINWETRPVIKEDGIFLNNEIGLSLGALKDIIQAGISTNFLIAGCVIAYMIQDINDKIESSKSRISDYGKEVVRVEQDG